MWNIPFFHVIELPGDRIDPINDGKVKEIGKNCAFLIQPLVASKGKGSVGGR